MIRALFGAAKGRCLREGVRVPFLIRWPGQVEPGTVSDEFLTALEVFPTLVNASGAKLPEGVVLDGFDMLAVLQEKTRSTRESMFWERQGEYGARLGQWKLVRSRRGGGLFDLTEDIGERNDLSETLPDIRERVEQSYRRWAIAMSEAEPRGPFKNY